MGQGPGKPGRHILRPGHVVTEASLRRELAAYADVGTSLSAGKAKTFLTDMAELLHLPPPDDLLGSIDSHGDASYSLDKCMTFFLSSVPAENRGKMLSDSLKDLMMSHLDGADVNMQALRSWEALNKTGSGGTPVIQPQNGESC